MVVRQTAVPSRDERGSATIELVVLMPVLLFILFGGVQGAVFYHARTLVIAAAQEGVRASAAESGSVSAGTSAASAFLAGAAGDSLTGVEITGSRTAAVASVTVRGTSLSLIPGWSPVVEQSATMPVERIT